MEALPECVELQDFAVSLVCVVLPEFVASRGRLVLKGILVHLVHVVCVALLVFREQAQAAWLAQVV
jgi:hypothetical protein